MHNYDVVSYYSILLGVSRGIQEGGRVLWTEIPLPQMVLEIPSETNRYVF